MRRKKRKKSSVGKVEAVWRWCGEEDGAGIDEKENRAEDHTGMVWIRADKKRQGENNDGKKSNTV